MEQVHSAVRLALANLESWIFTSKDKRQVRRLGSNHKCTTRGKRWEEDPTPPYPGISTLILLSHQRPAPGNPNAHRSAGSGALRPQSAPLGIHQ